MYGESEYVKDYSVSVSSGVQSSQTASDTHHLCSSEAHQLVQIRAVSACAIVWTGGRSFV